MAEKAFGRGLSLHHEHGEPVFSRQAAASGEQHELGAGGVVDDVEHALERREGLQRFERRGVAGRMHAHGRRVDDELCVRVPVKIPVVVGPRARDCRDRGRAEIAQHRAACEEGAARTEHQGISALGREPSALDHPGKARIVGVVAEKSAVGEPHDRIDGADCRRSRRQFRAVLHDRLLVRDRYVEALKVP